MVFSARYTLSHPACHSTHFSWVLCSLFPPITCKFNFFRPIYKAFRNVRDNLCHSLSEILYDKCFLIGDPDKWISSVCIYSNKCIFKIREGVNYISTNAKMKANLSVS